MRHNSMQWLRLAVVAALLVAVLPLTALAQDGSPQGEVVAEGFNGPMGVLVDSAGDIWVVDSGTGGDQQFEGTDPGGNPVTATFGMSARLVRIGGADGKQTEVAKLPSVLAGTEAEGGSRVAELRGIPYVTAPGWHPGMNPATAEEPLELTGSLLRITPAGEAVVSVPLWEYEKNNDVDGELDNHPYGLTATEDGALLVADAGGNALYRVNPASRRAKLLASFAPLPGAFPNPKYNNEMLTDPVPTGVTVRDGVIYVGFLSGFPYLPGNAKVVTVAEDGSVADYATGLTMLTDLRTGPDGELYAVQFAVTNEQGPTPDSGAIVRVKEGADSEVVVSGLPFPTSIAFNGDGDAFVTTNGVGAPGSGQLLKFAKLTDAKGSPLPAAAAGESASAAVTMTGTETMTGTQDAYGASTPAGEGASSVLASDQESDGASVTVDSVTAAVDGWMVIHADADGKPGAVLGETAVPAGTTDNVVVTLDPALAADGQLWAMLHVDAGEAGVYEFPGADVPATDKDDIVMAPFAVTVSGASAAATAAADQAPESLPATGGETSTPLAAAAAGVALLALAGAAFAFRRSA